VDSLAVDLDADGPQTVSVADSFETTGPFELVLRNHGTPAHVHLHLDDSLAAVATLGAANHYVEGGEDRVVAVDVADTFGTVTGRLEVATGYGAETGTVTVTVTEPPTVQVDQSLSEPQADPEPDSGVDAETAPVAAVAVLAVVVVVLAAALVGEDLALAVGLLAVAVAAGVAGYLLSQS